MTEYELNFFFFFILYGTKYLVAWKLVNNQSGEIGL